MDLGSDCQWLLTSQNKRQPDVCLPIEVKYTPPPVKQPCRKSNLKLTKPLDLTINLQKTQVMGEHIKFY